MAKRGGPQHHLGGAKKCNFASELHRMAPELGGVRQNNDGVGLLYRLKITGTARPPDEKPTYHSQSLNPLIRPVRPAQQHGQDCQRLIGHSDSCPALQQQLLRRQVEFESAKLDYVGGTREAI